MKKVIYIEANDLARLKERVNEEMQKGYELHGTVVVYERPAEDWTGPTVMFVQTLTCTQPD